MLKALDLDKFDASVQGWFRAVKTAAEDSAVGLAKTAFNHALYVSPQFSGAFVANWRMTYGTSADATQDHDPMGTKGRRPAPYQRGSPAAIGHAWGSQSARLNGFALGQTIYVSNSTKGSNEINRDGFQATMFNDLAGRIEAGQITLRPINDGADHILRRSVAYTIGRFSTIGPAQLRALRNVGV